MDTQKLKQHKIFLFIIPALLFILSCREENLSVVNYNHPALEYEGRVDTSNGEFAGLIWSGTQVHIPFEGTGVDVLMDDPTGKNYFNIQVNNDSTVLFHPGKGKKWYTLISALPEGKHSLCLFKRTEWTNGNSKFYAVRVHGNGKVTERPALRKRAIEFYGNSITAGYGVEDYSGNDSPDSTFTNNYLTYAAITARHFDARYHCICRSGIGIMLSWFPMIMPEMYDLLDPWDETRKWDFSKFTPDIVVVNLFQNDSWLVTQTDSENFKRRFAEPPSSDYIVDSYARFISQLREKYPEANIICMLGNMDATREESIWPEYIRRAVKKLNDRNVFTYFAEYKDTPGHPRIEEQQDMARGLIGFIEQNINW